MIGRNKFVSGVEMGSGNIDTMKKVSLVLEG